MACEFPVAVRHKLLLTAIHCIRYLLTLHCIPFSWLSNLLTSVLFNSCHSFLPMALLSDIYFTFFT